MTAASSFSFGGGGTCQELSGKKLTNKLLVGVWSIHIAGVKVRYTQLQRPGMH